MRKSERKNPCGVCEHYHHNYFGGETCRICDHRSPFWSEKMVSSTTSFPLERVNLCGICNHYHNYEGGEICGICGHRNPLLSEKMVSVTTSFPSEILPEFLYLGSFDDAWRAQLLKKQGISRLLNTVPGCQSRYWHTFIYYCVQDEKCLHFDDAIYFLEQCEKDKARVLVFCMSGTKRSPAFIIAYLMKCKRWRLATSYKWVKERRPSVDLPSAVYQKLQEYEQKTFESMESIPALPVVPLLDAPSFSSGDQKTNDAIPASDIVVQQELTLGAGQNENISNNPPGVSPTNGNDTTVGQ